VSSQRIDLAPVPNSIRTARGLVADVASAIALPAEITGAAVLAVSELVTNAVVHGRPPISLHVDVTTTDLLVSVSDGLPAAVVRPDIAGADATTGRGLAIVAAVTGDWGWDDDRGGKRIWFTLARGPGDSYR
jgi:anti-sigma regulatory factor (Ser/Thr protein kinase)